MTNSQSAPASSARERWQDKPSLGGLGSWDFGIGIVFLIVYAATLSPGLLPADSGEYQLTGALLGVAHPPGFALYTLLSWLSTRLLFWLTPALAINFLSAVCAALTLMLVSRAVRVWTAVPAAGLIAAAMLGVSTTFWAQATTANVRMFTALAVAWALAALADYQRAIGVGRPAGAPLRWAALALGVAVSHHGSTVFLAATLGGYALSLDWRVLRRPGPLLLGLLPFLLWLYFPLRAGAYGAPPNARTWNGFLDQILARGWSGDMLAFAAPAFWPERLRVFEVVLGFQWNWAIIGLMALGGLALLARDRRLGLALWAAWGAHAFIAVTYRAPQTSEYLLPAYVLMAAGAGFALAELGRVKWPAVRWALLAAGAAAAGWQFAADYPAYHDLAQTDETRATAQALLDQAPANTLLLTNWHWATPLWYLQQIEGRRPDVAVRYVVPQGAAYAQNWLDAITAAWPARPVVVTNFFKVEYAGAPYRFWPLASGWQVRAADQAPPAGWRGGQVFDGLELLGYTQTAPLAFETAWRVAGAPRDLNVYVHLMGPDGLLYAQHDVSHPAAHTAAGAPLVDGFALIPLRETPAGVYAVTAGAYTPEGTRLAAATLTTVTVAARLTPPVTANPGNGSIDGAALIGYDVDHSVAGERRLYLHWQLGAQPITVTPPGIATNLPAGPGYQTMAVEWPADQPLPAALPDLVPGSRYVPWGDDLLLTNISYDRRSYRPGERVAVDLEFRAARPIRRDLTVSVNLIGAGWRVQWDGTPVGGGLPTLKWITGSVIHDRYTLTLPADAAPGPATLTLSWYDAFTQQDLPILDPRLAQLGSTVPLGEVLIANGK